MFPLDRPFDLFDREREWADLCSLATTSAPGVRLGVVSGRRRQGKSFLLRALTKTTDGFYHQAQQLERRQALARFADDVARTQKRSTGTLHFDDWDIALRTALGYPARGSTMQSVDGGPRLLVLDELPYLLVDSPEIPSVLQELIDEAAANRYPARCIIACGSALSVMQELLSGTNPLRGRAHLDLMIKPFNYRTAAQYWNISDPEVAFHVDAVLGGTAGYRTLIEQAPPTSIAEFPTWLGHSVLNPSHALFQERAYLLREDLRITSKQLYNSVLAAVAAGNHTQKDICSVVGRNAAQLRHPLLVLESAGFLIRSDDVLTKLRPTYRIADPIVRFAEVVVQPYQVPLEAHDITTAWSNAHAAFRSAVLGPHFEQLCRDWVAGSGTRLWPQGIGEVGTTVVNDAKGRTQFQLDVVGLQYGDRRAQSDARVVLLGEAKSGGKQRTVADLNRLRRIRDLLATRGSDVANATLAVFGRAGFDDNLRAAASDDAHVLLVDLTDLYASDPSILS